jgi:tryptophanyl-tRNA synthetase
MTRVLSGVQPSGDMHLGNYLGAFRSWVEDQHHHQAFYCVVDLHALTAGHDPTVLAERTLDTVANLLAVGLDPTVCTVFVQSHVAAHSQLTWLLECTASMGELRRMTQFKDKTAASRAGGRDITADATPADAPAATGSGSAAGTASDTGTGTASSGDTARVGLFTYPVLMAADILLYDADRVPVGEDQRQHLELARTLATRFNHRYGPTFTVPKAAVPPVAARVMDLQQPTRKMSKSSSSPQGVIRLQDDPDTIRRKVRRAVTDTDTAVTYDPTAKPGVANLLELLGAATGQAPSDLAGSFTSYGQLKTAVGDALVELLHPIQQRYATVRADPAELERVVADGRDRAAAVADATWRRAARHIGLLPG